MIVPTFARRCSNLVSAGCSISRWSSDWKEFARNGRSYKATIWPKLRGLGFPSNEFLPTSRRDLLLLPAETEKVWNFLKDQTALAGFVLADGSALALIIRHRISEDLDFVYPDVRLP